jgi:2-polyprenyl-3-methyl-5-hydroxy-6-metoxy-1,4-benzoquinol methylase
MVAMSFFPRDLGAHVPGPVVEWEEPNCLLCGGRNWTTLVEAPDLTPGGTGLWFAVVQCHDCGLCFTNPRPSPNSISQFYPSAYLPHLRRNSRRPSSPWQRLSRFWKRPRKERRALAWHGQGRLLDFGCGAGGYLERMHQQGWQVTGIDCSAKAVQGVRSELGLNALIGSLPHPELTRASFDVITMWHSLEHVHQPLEVLRQAHRLLVPGGKLVVAVPNIDSLPFRWFGHTWFGLDLPRHLTHFAPWTLQLMLERAGFQVTPIRMVRHSDWLRSSAKLACATSPSVRWHRWLRSKLPSSLASWYGYLTWQSDCMMVTARKL